MKSFFLFFVGTLLWAVPLQAQSRTLTEAVISFTFPKNVKGSIAGFTSASKIDTNDLANSYFEGSVLVKTLNTHNSLRNWHLKRKKFFNADTFPKITFKSTQVTPSTTGISVLGELTIKDITKPVSFQFKKEGNTLKGTTTIYSSDFDINIKKKREDNKVVVTLIFTLD